MTSVRTKAIVPVVLGLLALAPAASAATKETDAAAVGFTGPGGRVAVLGDIQSPAARCVGGRKVALVAERDGDDKLLDTDLSSRNGGFSFRERVPQDATNLIVAVKGKRISKSLKCARDAAEVIPAQTPVG